MSMCNACDVVWCVRVLRGAACVVLRGVLRGVLRDVVWCCVVCCGDVLRIPTWCCVVLHDAAW